MKAHTLLVALVLGLSPAAGAQPALDAARLSAAARPSAYAAAVRDLYAARAYRPLWTGGAAPGAPALSAEGRTLIGVLAHADADGLDPAAYATPGGSTAEAREVALADALLRYASDLMRGRVDPARVHRDWDAQRRPFDPAAVLARAAERGPAAVAEAARPPHAAYARLREALARYRALAADGGWPALPDGPALRPGDRGPAVAVLRERLRREGFAAGAGSDTYDPVLVGAVRAAQARFGLAADGVVGPATRAALSVTAGDRARQIALNLERWRWLPAALGARHLVVNAAGMEVEVVGFSGIDAPLRAIVGTLDNPTPGFSSAITEVVLSPYWYVPESIARGEIRPRLRRDPGYLARHDMTVLPGGALRQAPGPANPLGPVKFIFASRFGVRLHGTANPALFDQSRRAFSHGCIRVERPLALAERLLYGTGWDAARIDATVARGQEVRVPLPSPVPIHVVYWTAWVAPDGAVHFRDDLYGRDRTLARALPAPVRSAS